MQLAMFQAPARSLTLLQQVLNEDDVERMVDAFAGRTIYIPKRSNRRIAVEYIIANPQATTKCVMIVCSVSRATVYRARQEIKHGRYRLTQELLQEGTDGVAEEQQAAAERW